MSYAQHACGLLNPATPGDICYMNARQDTKPALQYKSSSAQECVGVAGT